MLDLVVAKALEKDAEARYQDAAHLSGDLRACLHQLAQLAWQRIVRDSDLRLMVGLIAAGLISGMLLAVI